MEVKKDINDGLEEKTKKLNPSMKAQEEEMNIEIPLHGRYFSLKVQQGE
jgi:hypothetical protein